jgi:hypothetical protein
MVYCVLAELAFSSSARRQLVLDDIVARIAGRARWGVDEVEATVRKDGAVSIKIQLRFVSRLDADDLMARIDAFATGQRTPLAGSWLTVHDCSHDGPPQPCVPDARRDW